MRDTSHDYIFLDDHTKLEKFHFTKYGEFMYQLTYKGAMFLYKNKWLYYLLALTWGVLLTLLGLVATLVVMCFGKFPKAYKGIYYQSIFKNWGGWEFGLMFLCDEDENIYIKKHELGHTYQNALLGIFQPFLVWLPSAFRYQWREHIYRVQKRNPKKYPDPLPSYDAI